jgi:hypothetical protein
MLLGGTVAWPLRGLRSRPDDRHRRLRDEADRRDSPLSLI